MDSNNTDVTPRGESRPPPATSVAGDHAHQADFSIGPNADYYVPRPEDHFEQLSDTIANTRGGVFGITGVRGAGKSVLLNRIKKEFQDRHHTLQIPAPVSSSHETAFLAMLFQQLCGSVINYIEEKVFGRKTGSVGRGHAELRRWLWAVFFYLPLIAALGYGMWFFWSFYDEHTRQREQFETEIKVQVNLLLGRHNNGIAKLEEAIRVAVLSTGASTGAEPKVTEELNKAKAKLRDTEEQIARARKRLDRYDWLLTWEREFSRVLAPLLKMIGDRPHSALLAYLALSTYDKDGSVPKIRAVLDQFFALHGTHANEVEKKFGFNLSEVEYTVDKFLNQFEKYFRFEKNFRPEFRNDLYDLNILVTEKGEYKNYGAIQLQLTRELRLTQDQLNKSRQNKLDLESALLKLLKLEQSASQEQEEMTKERQSELDAKLEEVEAIADNVEREISDLGDYTLLFEFDIGSLETWTRPTLPAERHAEAKRSGRYKIRLDRLHTALRQVQDGLRELLGELNAAQSDAAFAYKKGLETELGLASDALGRIGESQAEFYRLRKWGFGPVVLAAVVIFVLAILALFAVISLKLRTVLIYGNLLGLLKQSEEVNRSLEFEVTRSQGSRFDLPLFERIGASYKPF